MASSERPSPKSSGIKQIFGLSVAAHVLGIGGYQGVTRIQEAQQVHALKETSIRAHETRERRRDAIVERAVTEMEAGQLNVWTFLRDAATVEAEAADLPAPDRTAMQQEYARVHDRFHERWQDQWHVSRPEHVQVLIRDLQHAFQGYNYYAGMKTINPLSVMRDRGGPCGGTTLAVLAELQQSEGIRDQLRVHYYPPGDHGESGHLAPTIVFEDEQHHLQEFDLTSARPAFPSGTRMTLTELVEGYAHMHHKALTPQDPSRWSHTTQVQGGDGGFGFDIPTPTDRRPFPAGTVPFYSENIFGDFQLTPPQEVRVRSSQESGSSAESQQAPLSFQIAESSGRFARMNFMAFQSLEAQERDGEIPVGVQTSFSSADWRQLSTVISEVERSLPGFDKNDSAYLLALGRMVSLYQVAHDRSALERRVDPTSFAAEKLHTYRAEATQWIQQHHTQLQQAEYRRALTRTETGIMFLTVLGGTAVDILFDQFQGEQDTDRKRAIVLPLLLSDQTRERAVPLFTRLSYTDQLYVLEHASVFFSESFVSDMHTEVFFNRHDAFGDAYQEYNALFSDLVSRTLTGLVPENSSGLHFETATRSVIRTLPQLQEEIHRSAQLHGHSQEWEDHALLYGIEEIRASIDYIHSLPPSFRSRFLAARETMRPFFTEAIRWMDAHPSLPIRDTRTFTVELL